MSHDFPRDEGALRSIRNFFDNYRYAESDFRNYYDLLARQYEEQSGELIDSVTVMQRFAWMVAGFASSGKCPLLVSGDGPSHYDYFASFHPRLFREFLVSHAASAALREGLLNRYEKFWRSLLKEARDIEKDGTARTLFAKLQKAVQAAYVQKVVIALRDWKIKSDNLLQDFKTIIDMLNHPDSRAMGEDLLAMIKWVDGNAVLSASMRELIEISRNSGSGTNGSSAPHFGAPRSPATPAPAAGGGSTPGMRGGPVAYMLPAQMIGMSAMQMGAQMALFGPALGMRMPIAPLMPLVTMW